MYNKTVFTIISLSILFLLTTADLQADFYKYKDDNGNPVITNDINTIPQKYRDKVEVYKNVKELEEGSKPMSRKVKEKSTEIGDKISIMKDKGMRNIQSAKNDAVNRIDSVIDLDSIKTWIIISSVLSVLVLIGVRIFVREKSYRLMINLMLIACINLACFATYFGRTFNKSESNPLKAVTSSDSGKSSINQIFDLVKDKSLNEQLDDLKKAGEQRKKIIEELEK